MSRSFVAVTLASFLWFSSPAASADVLASGTGPPTAQLEGGLAGVIRDATGAVLPGVAVSVSGDALTGTRTTMTNAQGRYEFGNLPAGLWRITATLRGFDPHTAEGRIAAGVTAVDLVLTVSSVFEVVTVTATKTSATDIQSTPAAITALGGAALEQMAAHSVEDLAGMVPALTISQHTGLAQVTIRGIGTNLIFTGSDPSSTIHVDGVYLARPAMVFADFLDVERVEVLRGPQGTLYGRNSVGGTINIITRQPTNALHTSVRLTAGSYDTLRAEGDVSGPLIKDKVMASFAFIRGTRSGFVNDLDHPDHSLGGEDTWAGRGRLRFVFGSKSELLLSGDYGRFARVFEATGARRMRNVRLAVLEAWVQRHSLEEDAAQAALQRAREWAAER